MELLSLFKQSLIENNPTASKITIRNYIADVKKFISWYESTFQRNFPPPAIPNQVIESYLENIKDVSPRSAKRYTSSLRKFFGFLTEENIITYNPLAIKNEPKQITDPLKIRDFDNYLYNLKSSELTRKNYINDVNQFLNWLATVTEIKLDSVSNQDDLFDKIDSFAIEQYKDRLLNEAKISPASINRKLSSLRKYIAFAAAKGFIKSDIIIPESIQDGQKTQNIIQEEIKTEEIYAEPTLDFLRNIEIKPQIPEDISKEYSKHPPIRLFQKTHSGLNLLYDGLVVLSIIKSLDAIKHSFWKATGSQLFQPVPKVIKSLKNSGEIISGLPEIPSIVSAPDLKIQKAASALDNFIKAGKLAKTKTIKGLPKSSYAPLKLSTAGFPIWKKVTYFIRFYRPKWYRRYHNQPIAHYINFAIIIIFSAFLGFKIYEASTRPYTQVAGISSKVSPNRLISFQGVLHDATDTPITKESLLRFAIYKSPTASGSAQLWEERQTVTPDLNGKFSVRLGRVNPLSNDIFLDNPNLYLGISIGNDPELFPRQELASTALSKNSQELQGLKPITGNNAQTENVILALDSSGNLTIGGTGSPIFQATGGEFKLSGEQLTLATNEGSNTNIVLSPDGAGIIDVQKPLQNTSEDNILAVMPGAVQIDDNLAINASSSAQSALVIKQNSTGDLISASTGDTARFSVSNTGTVTIGEDLNIIGNYFTTSTSTFSLANTNTVNLNIGGAATSVSLGGTSGTTTINHSLNVKGALTANAGIMLPEFKEGTIPFIGASGRVMADEANLFWDSVNKRVGIGTKSPTLRLDVQDSQTASSVTQIFNTSTSSTATGLSIKLGITTAPQSGNRWINFLDGNGAILGKIRGNNSTNTVTFDANGGDFAEYFKRANPNEQLEAGDIVCYAKEGGVEKCGKSSNGIVGIVSDNAGFVGNGAYLNNSDYILVGLIGQLNLNLSSESDNLSSGDPVTYDVEKGTGIKATKAGQIVGRALEGYTSNSGQKSVKVALNVSWYDPSAIIMDDGRVATAFANNQLVVHQSSEAEFLEKIAKSSQNFIDTLNVGVLEAQSISVNSLSIATENVMIGTQTLKDYIEGIANDVFDRRLASLNTTQTESDDKKNIILSPLVEENQKESSSVELSPTPSPVEIAQSSQSAQASPSGNVINITNIYNNASQSAAHIPQISTSPTPAEGEYTENSASPSGSTPLIPTPTLNLLASHTLSKETSENLDNNMHFDIDKMQSKNSDIASFSAELSYVPNLNNNIPQSKFEFGSFSQGLISLGPASFAETSVSGTLSIGTNMKITHESIDSIGADLNIQPLRQGNLSIMSGLVTIDTQGNLTVEGNATFAKDVTVRGKLASNIIAPVPGQDLIFNLEGKDSQPKIEVKTASDGAVLSINQLGDIISSGSAQFRNFKIIRGVQADTSFTETHSDGSAGTAVISKYETERTIITPFVAENSLIYITLVSDSNGQTPYIARQTIEAPESGSRGSFTIQIPSPAAADIKLNWWIIN